MSPNGRDFANCVKLGCDVTSLDSSGLRSHALNGPGRSETTRRCFTREQVPPSGRDEKKGRETGEQCDVSYAIILQLPAAGAIGRSAVHGRR